MNTDKSIKPRYEFIAYDGQTINNRTMTRQQVGAINPQSFDYFLSTAFGIWGFRTKSGEWIEYCNGDWQGIGTTCIKIIQALQINPGEFLSPAEIVGLTGYHSLRNSNTLSARLMAIREAHKETHKNRNFFRSRRAGGYGIAWNSKKTWAWVERIRPTLGGE